MQTVQKKHQAPLRQRCAFVAQGVCTGRLHRALAQGVCTGRSHRAFARGVCTGRLHRAFAQGVRTGRTRTIYCGSRVASQPRRPTESRVEVGARLTAASRRADASSSPTAAHHERTTCRVTPPTHTSTAREARGARWRRATLSTDHLLDRRSPLAISQQSRSSLAAISQ